MNEVANIEISPLALIEKAIVSGVSMTGLEKLFELQVRWEKMQADKAFKSAFVLFQKNKPVLKKKTHVDMGVSTEGKTRAKFNYLPLPILQQEIEPILCDCELFYRWEVANEEEGIKVTCIVSHVSGHEERTSIKGPADESGKKQPIQGIGSSISYLKRYTLEAALGLSSDEDKDGAKEYIVKGDDNYLGAYDALKKGVVSLAELKSKFDLSPEVKKEFLKLDQKSKTVMP